MGSSAPCKQCTLKQPGFFLVAEKQCDGRFEIVTGVTAGRQASLTLSRSKEVLQEVSAGLPAAALSCGPVAALGCRAHHLNPQQSSTSLQVSPATTAQADTTLHMTPFNTSSVSPSSSLFSRHLAASEALPASCNRRCMAVFVHTDLKETRRRGEQNNHNSASCEPSVGP